MEYKGRKHFITKEKKLYLKKRFQTETPNQKFLRKTKNPKENQKKRKTPKPKTQ